MKMQEGKPGSRRTHLSIALFLIVIPLLLASIQSKFSIFVFRDGFATHYPIKKLFIEQIKNKVIPFWNPSASFGQPLLGNPNVLPFYPDNVLFLALPFDVAWNFHFWFHWIFGAIGVFQLLKCIQRSSRVSLLGSIWWAGSGFILSLFSFYNLIAAASWVPWIVLSFRLLLTNGKIRNAIALGTCIGLQFLAGEPVTCLSTWVLLCVFLFDLRKEVTIQKITLTILAAILSILIVLPQVVALSEIYAYTSRSLVKHSFVTSTNSSFEPKRFLEWMVPYCWGIPFEKAPSLFLGKRFSHFPFFIHSVHLSLLLLLCGLLGLRKTRPIFLGTALFFMLLCLGRYAPVWRIFFEYIPGFSSIRFPIKFFSALLLLLILIATEGAGELFQGSTTRLRVSVIFLGALWLISQIVYLSKASIELFFITQILIAGGMLVILTLVVLRFRQFVVLFLIVESMIGARFLWLGVNQKDLLAPAYAPALSRTYVSRDMYPLNPAYTNEKELYHDESAAAYPLWGSPFRFRYALEDSPEGLYSYYNDYILGFFQTLSFPEKFQMLSRLGVGQVIMKQTVTAEGWKAAKVNSYYEYSTPDPTPMVFPATTIQTQTMPGLTLRGILEGQAVYTRWKVLENKFVAPKSFQYKEVSPSTFRIELESQGPVFLATRITYFPVWQASGVFPDGLTRPLRVNQIDLAFVGVEVPAGVRSVTLFYGSRIQVGMLILWMVLVGGLCILAAARMPRQH